MYKLAHLDEIFLHIFGNFKTVRALKVDKSVDKSIDKIMLPKFNILG